MPTLVIVDMQQWFLSELTGKERDTLINGVCNAVHIFKKNNHPIIALQYKLEHGFNLYDPIEREDYEYENFTHSEIRKAIGNYDKFHVKWKNTDSGSIQVKNCIRKHKYDGDIYLCGVNAGACVKSTWYGLTKEGRRFIAHAIREISKNVWDFNDSVHNYISDVISFNKVVEKIDN